MIASTSCFKIKKRVFRCLRPLSESLSAGPCLHPPPRLIDITRYSQVQSQHFPHLSAGPTTEICTAGLLTYSSLLQHLPNLCERCSPAVSGLCRMIPCGRKLQQRVLSRTRRLLGFACINRDWRTTRTATGVAHQIIQRHILLNGTLSQHPNHSPPSSLFDRIVNQCNTVAVANIRKKFSITKSIALFFNVFNLKPKPFAQKCALFIIIFVTLRVTMRVRARAA